MKTQKKVNKKAWREIKQISMAISMMDVNSLICEALLKTFGLWNLGLQKIKMANDEKFEVMKARRLSNMETHGKEAKAYLISFIPDRLKHTIMYKELINS